MTISSVTQTITTPNLSGAAAPGSGAAFQVPSIPTSATASPSGTISAFNPYQSLSADLQSALLGIQDSTSPAGATGGGQSSGTQTDGEGRDSSTIAQAGGHHHHHRHGGGAIDPTPIADTAGTTASQTPNAAPSGG